MEWTPRKKKILAAIVDAYIETGEPIGSKFLVERLEEQVSSATVRNVMAELAAEGYLEQPHTSAGRIPTAPAFRFYIDHLMCEDALSDEDQENIDTALRRLSDSPDQLVEEASRILATTTGYAAVTTTPDQHGSAVRRIELMPLSTRKAAMLLVTDSGVLRNRTCRFEQEVQLAELDKLGIGYSALSGSVPSEKRKALMDEFWGNPDCRVFLSTDAGSTGLNLQIASLIINLDLPWNPAVLEQRIGRIYRIGQKRNIQVINMISKDSFEERMLATLDFKASLSDGILDGGDDTVILDDNKMNKLMDTVTEFVEESGQKGVGSMPMDSEVLQGEAVATAPEDVSVAEVPDLEQPDEESAEETESYNPEKLVEKGVEFLSGLAETLKSPEKTARLVNSIVHTDPESGRQELRIPLPGKDTVESILGLVAKIMSK